MLNRIPVRSWLLAGGALLLAACGGGAISETPASVDSADSSAASGASVTSGGVSAESTAAAGSPDVVYQFPTGPAVTVPVGYMPPGDRVPETGTYLPANGKPTLVFVDAIW
ncbi:MAG: hypothetical protein HOH95_13650 [Dehalococcoidia bacterium]|jgi:hypothetical protein|nr:hypothetical protein [Dehalococcoidia bacterium]